jgi:ActR/RegA family two-component response regulator
MRQRTNRPTRKVAAGVSAATVATLVSFFALRLFGVVVPADVALALATVVLGAVMYLVPPAEADAPVPAARRRRDPIGH